MDSSEVPSSSERGENQPGRGVGRRVSFSVPPKETFKPEAELPALVESERSVSDPDTVTKRPRSSSQTSQQYYQRRRSSVAEVVLERFARTRERRWSVGISSLVVSLTALLMGITIGYPSNALLDLTGEATELPSDYLLSTLMLSLFAVSLMHSAMQTPCHL